MTKKELIAKLAEKTELKKVEVENLLNLLVEEVETAVKAKEDFTINGLGTFKVTHRAERKGRNPKTGEELTIPAKDVVTFKTAKSLNDLVK